MKIACITDDGRTISAHFGRANYYLVATVEDGAVTGKEMRDKLGHAHFTGEDHADAPGSQHGMDPASHDRHVSMALAIQDCEVLLCRGMGRGAYLSMERVGIKPLVTDVTDIDEALRAYMDGDLEDRTELLH